MKNDRIRKLLALLAAAAIPSLVLCAPADALKADFESPPDSARVHSWWHWIHGHVTKDGITKDLEGMQRVGVRGVTLFSAGFFPAGDLVFMSEDWWDHVGHAMREADRLGIQFGAYNSDGWSMSGGPWITPEQSMKEIVWTETDVSGGRILEQTLPQPRTRLIYRDIAVLAFPTPAHQQPIPVKAVLSAEYVEDSEALLDGDPQTRARFVGPVHGGPSRITFDLGEPSPVRRATFDGLRANNFLASRARLEASRDGESFEPVEGSFPLNLKAESSIKQFTFAFPMVEARYLRLTVDYTASSTVTPVPMSQDSIGIGKVAFFRSPRVGLWEPKSGHSKRIRHDRQTQFRQELDHHAAEELPREYRVSKDRIVDLTDKIDPNGTLAWEAPAGDWTIQRIGYTSTGRVVQPSTEAGRGLECDKMSVAATEAHFRGYVAKVDAFSRKVVGKPLGHMQMESWEAGIQNWTEGFEVEFERRNGYSILPYLPVMAGGYVVGSDEESNRFLWDLRRTVANMMSENYWGTMLRLSHELGIRVFGEGSGMQHYLYDPILYMKQTDVPMGEFWSSEAGPRADCKGAASVAHTYGRSIVAAEAFTGGDDNLWEMTPYDFKRMGDEAFALGVNHFVLHSHVHQPYDIPPGFTLLRFGNHFQRLNPWYAEADGWMNYLARSQLMLRQGRFVGDLCYFTGEGIPGYLGLPHEVTPALPEGYDYDGVNLELIRTMEVRDGRLVLPSGSSYALLVFQGTDRMTPELVAQVRRLVSAGATVVAPRPEGSPSLSGYPACDETVRQVALDVWGDQDAFADGQNEFGRGRVVWGKPLADLLAEAGVPPDFRYTTGSDAKIRYLHRKTETADIYFLASDRKAPVKVEAEFRASSDRHPSYWDPVFGTIEPISDFSRTERGVRIPLEFSPLGSKFIVFSTAASSAAGPADRAKLQEVNRLAIDGPWQVRFQPVGGVAKPFSIQFKRLVDWSTQDNEDVRYFSGTGVYQTTFNLEATRDRRFVLDLGEVKHIARVFVNGVEVANLWKPPYRVGITDYVNPGQNELSIEVTNTMVNRMIGDASKPQDVVYNDWGPIKEIPAWLEKPETRTSGRQTFITYPVYDRNSALAPSGLLGPVRVIIQR